MGRGIIPTAALVRSGFNVRVARLALVTVLTLGLTISAPGIAAAAAPWKVLTPEGKPVPPPVRAPFYSVAVVILDTVSLRLPIMLISADVRQQTKLPVEVAVPFPSRYYIQWAGEVLGGPTSADPQTQPLIERKRGYDLAVFTLNKGRTAEIELPVPGMVRAKGGRRTVSFTWTAAEAVPQVSLAVRVSSGSKIVKITPGATGRTGPDGVEYSKYFTFVKPGQRLSMQVTYVRPGASAGGSAGSTGAGAGGAAGGAQVPATPAQSTPDPGTLPVALGLLLAAGIVGVLLVRGKRAS